MSEATNARSRAGRPTSPPDQLGQGVYIRLLPHEKSAVQKHAERDSRTMSAQIRSYVRAGLAQEEVDREPA